MIVLVMGIGATLGMDLWNVLLKKAFGIPSLNYCLLGRWVSYMPQGRFIHRSILAAEQRPMECATGWVAHYSIGVMLSVGFAMLVGETWFASPTLLPALLYGVATVVFPLFVMQPALGVGSARARLKSMGTHLVFGLGLFGWAWLST